MGRRRRRGGYSQKAAVLDTPQTIGNMIALGNASLPQLEAYWFLYQKHPTVASCVNLIANTVAGDGYSVQPAKGDANDLNEDPRVELIDEFWNTTFVNKDTMRRAMFALCVDMLVFARAYWRKRRPKGSQQMVGLERVDPRLVLPKPNGDRSAIQSFLVRRQHIIDAGFIQVADNVMEPDVVDPKDMVFFTRGGGDQILGAPAPLEHLDMTIGLDLGVRRYRRAFFGNGATPGKIIIVKTANRDVIRQIEEKVGSSKAGPDNAFRNWVLAGPEGGIDIQDRASDNSGQKDFDFVKGSGINREEICSVFHVPVGKITFASNALGSSGKAEDDATFQEQCVLPLEEELYEIITRDILHAEFGMTDLEMAPKRRHALRLDLFDAAEKLVKFGGTPNEARELVNLKKRTDIPRMDDPSFIGATGQDGMISDQLDASNSAQPGAVEIQQSNDAATDEVAQKGASRFPAWY